MTGNESGGLETPERSAASTLTTKPTSGPLEDFGVCYTPNGRPPRKLSFDETQRGDYLRTVYEWTGCRWREAGFERCEGVELEVGETIPPTLAIAVLAKLFDAAFRSATMTDVDVLNALAREAFDEETTSKALTQGELEEGDE